MTPKQIKEELIKMGWEDNLSECTQKMFSDDLIILYDMRGYLLLELSYDSLVIKSPTLPQIKALIFGLTGEEV